MQQPVLQLQCRLPVVGLSCYQRDARGGFSHLLPPPPPPPPAVPPRLCHRTATPPLQLPPPPHMDWEFSPQRRVLLENAGFVYAFGNTKRTSLFRDNYQPANQPTVAPPLLLCKSSACSLLRCAKPTPLTLCQLLPRPHVLLLGFGDVRNLLLRQQRAPPPSRPPTAGSYACTITTSAPSMWPAACSCCTWCV